MYDGTLYDKNINKENRCEIKKICARQTKQWIEREYPNMSWIYSEKINTSTKITDKMRDMIKK